MTRQRIISLLGGLFVVALGIRSFIDPDGYRCSSPRAIRLDALRESDGSELEHEDCKVHLENGEVVVEDFHLQIVIDYASFERAYVREIEKQVPAAITVQ